MGQLFNRLRRFAASQLAADTSHATNSSYADMDLSDDDELRRIINELSGKTEHKTNHQPPPQRPPQASIPRHVLAAHTVLNVRVGATVQEIKQAYRKAIATWHPDKFVRAETKLQQEAHTNARKINAAYMALEEFYKFG